MTDMESCSKRTEHRGASFDPELGGLLAGGQIHGDHERAHAKRVVVTWADVAVWKQ